MKKTKIAFIAPGEINIPTDGWGALETVVWNQKIQLDNAGYDTVIINESNAQATLEAIQKYKPDVVHLHYGKHYEILQYINCKKIITNHDGSFLYSKNFHENIIRSFMYDCIFFILTTWEKDLLLKLGFNINDIHIIPNGVDCNKFITSIKPKYYDKSLCLGKIDERKNQTFLQQLKINIDFVGQNNDKNFDPIDNNYLGQWSREQVYNSLTDYSNLVLLSQSELQPLVCLEAMAAGLGLVISESCCQNLDTSLKFIDVIPENELKNSEYIKTVINNNRNYCNSIDRNTIINYAKTFDWNNIIKLYINYLP